MEVPRITQDQVDTLIETLSDALEQLVDRCCLEMAPLWLAQTRQERKPLGDAGTRGLGFEPSIRYLALSKGARSRYRYLATWRHACLCEQACEEISDPDHRRAVETVYFTPFPDDAPPYAWSSRASAAPGADRFPSATSLKHYAKEGVYETVLCLVHRVRALDRGSWFDEVQADLLRTGCRKTVREALKLEDFEPWDEP